MAKRKKVTWQIGDVFAVALKNGTYAVGHVLDQRMVNSIRIALYNELLNVAESFDVSNLCKADDLISLIEVSKEQLEYGVWKIIGNKGTDIPVNKFANEQYRSQNWTGSLVHDAALAEDFLNAFYALIPWDDWYDPYYLDGYLVDKSKKPKNLILVKSWNSPFHR